MENNVIDMPTAPPEEWRAVVGYEGLYSISSLGRLRSEERLVVRRVGSYRKPAAIMNPGAGKSKYLSARLTNEMGASTHYIHTLVLSAFVGPRPDGFDACHGDGNRQNNSATNLRWDTRSGNHADKRAHGTGTIGERHPMAKLTEAQVLDARRMRIDGHSITFLANHFNVSRQTAYRAASGRSWSHVK